MLFITRGNVIHNTKFLKHVTAIGGPSYNSLLFEFGDDEKSREMYVHTDHIEELFNAIIDFLNGDNKEKIFEIDLFLSNMNDLTGKK